jgi:holo-[acyl-carrier protein] synthase
MIAGDALGVAGASPVVGAAGSAGLAAALISAPGVLGVGIDVVAVERFATALRRTPPLAARLFAGAERVTGSGHPRSPASLAARFAVKEAVAKALGVPAGMDWHDCSVVSESSGRPVLRVTGTVAAASLALGIRDWRISLSHDAGIAAAIVVGLG